VVCTFSIPGTLAPADASVAVSVEVAVSCSWVASVSLFLPPPQADKNNAAAKAGTTNTFFIFNFTLIVMKLSDLSFSQENHDGFAVTFYFYLVTYKFINNLRK